MMTTNGMTYENNFYVFFLAIDLYIFCALIIIRKKTLIYV